MSFYEYVDKSFVCSLIIIVLLIVIAIAVISCMNSLKEIKQRMYFVQSEDQDNNC